jgi:hypothetical protein
MVDQIFLSNPSAQSIDSILTSGAHITDSKVVFPFTLLREVGTLSPEKEYREFHPLRIIGNATWKDKPSCFMRLRAWAKKDRKYG